MSKYQKYNEKLPTFSELEAILEKEQVLTPTGKDILGPFYRPGSPFRTNIAQQENIELYLTGTVKDTNDNLVKDNCYIEFWQADKNGKYDELGPMWRGIQQVTDGTYRLETVKPGFYDISDPSAPQPHDFRCSHIHAKIWFNGVDVLTTQLYFTNSPYDNTDHWFNKNRCIKFAHDSMTGTFDFVVVI